MLQLLNDPRDLPQARLVLQCTVIVLAAAGLFAAGSFSWWFAAGYWALWGSLFGDRVTTMLHTFIHRPLFKRKYGWLNEYVTWVIAPLFGQTPTSFYVHHIGMHHPEQNLSRDLSSTMHFQRDSFPEFLRYYLRFVLLGTPELIAYHWKKRRTKLLARFVGGKLFWWALVGALAAWSWQPTLVVLVIPYLLTDFMLMAGNFAQHSLIDPDAPADPFKSSITCLSDRYNGRCFNDGYHTFHHVRPTAHYSELRQDFEQNREKYGQADAIVFEQLDFISLWFLLMTHRYRTIARYFVRLPGAPARTDDEVVALLRRRVARIEAVEPQPTPVST